MRNRIFAAATGILFILASCSKKDNDIPGPDMKGPLDGTYKMISSQTEVQDTLESSDGSIWEITNENYIGSAFTGTLSVTKDRMNCVNMKRNMYKETMLKKIFPGIPPVITTDNSVIFMVDADNLQTGYTLTADSVFFPNRDEANAIVAVQDWARVPRVKYTLADNKLTFTGDYYTFIPSGGSLGYINKRRVITTTIYQKQ